MKKDRKSERLKYIDVHVGIRLRLRRIMLGMTQTDLGRALGLSFMQIQKYETALDRVSASRLFDLSLILDVPIDYFFEGVGASQIPVSLPKLRKAASRGQGDELGLLMKRESLELARAYTAIPDPHVRRRLREVCYIAVQAQTDCGVEHPSGSRARSKVRSSREKTS